MLAEFRKDKKIELFGQADFNIHHHETFKDSNPTMLKKPYVKYLKKQIPKKDITSYWKKDYLVIQFMNQPMMHTKILKM